MGFELSGTARAVLAGAALAVSFAGGAAASTITGTPSPNPSFGNYLFPPASTNADNYLNNLHHVLLSNAETGAVELKFVNPTNVTAFFEWRIDDEPSQYGNIYPHPTISDDFYYFYLSLDAGDDRTVRFTVDQFVDIRSAFGPERDWDFDWTRFEAPGTPAAPIPLPAAGWLLIGGLGALVAVRRRKTAA